MHIVRSFPKDDAAQVGWAARTLLVSVEADPASARRLAGLGARIECCGDLYTALSVVMEDPGLADLLVVDCDGLGGLAEVRRIVRLMGEVAERAPVILVSAEATEQTFSMARLEPTILRAPLSAVALRVAFEHVLRGKVVPRFA